MLKRIRKLQKMNRFLFLYYNFFCKKVIRKRRKYLIPYKHAVIRIGKGSRIVINDTFYINDNRVKGSHEEAHVNLRKNATLTINGETALCYGSLMELHDNAEIVIGSAYINSGSVLLAAKNIRVGRDVLISRGTYIYDSDHHDMIDGNGEKLNPAKDVLIEDHVWIGLNCTILRGSHIGEGAMISAGSVVGSRIKSHSLASGNPARTYAAVEWRR